ncbi:hypothetical protein ACFV84_33125 [Kitasatospora sp. NPDC059811]|uniref:hypothetical protein n=1 Tax=unclassified Kitasatospora TaxID=2633591 RepID=UPI00364CC084
MVERLLLVEAMAELALPRPDMLASASAWLTSLADDTALDPTTRLAALIQHARCTPDFHAQEATRTAIALLREQTAPTGDWWLTPTPATPAPTIEPGSAPVEVIAAFEDLDRHATVHSPVTGLLRTFHEVLGARVPERTMLLAEQLRSADPGTRLDALRMGSEIIKSRSGDHSPLVALIGAQLADPYPEVVAEAASALGTCHPVPEPARPVLVAFVAAQHAQYGPQAWASPQRHLRRAHQEAVLALARLGDERALPSLLVALDGGVDAWRAVQAAKWLPGAAGQLVPSLVERLLGFDLDQQWIETEVNSTLQALGHLGGTAALGAVEEVLDRAVRAEKWGIVCSALAALRQFGPAAAPALPVIRELAALGAAVNSNVAPAAVAALRAIEGDAQEGAATASGPTG